MVLGSSLGHPPGALGAANALIVGESVTKNEIAGGIVVNAFAVALQFHLVHPRTVGGFTPAELVGIIAIAGGTVVEVRA